jgi:hypothetical protein
MALKMIAQTGKTPSYLAHNPYSYCFKMFVPKDLQRFFLGKKGCLTHLEQDI